MYSKIILVATMILFSIPALAESLPVQKMKTLEVTLERSPMNQDRYQDLLTELSYKEGINQELKLKSIEENDILNFWNKIEEKKLDLKAELLLLKPLFLKESFLANPTLPNTQSFSYEIDAVKLQALFETLTLGYDLSQKTLFIYGDISIGRDMTWADVGVSNEANFTGVILDSWKKWALTQFKKFPQVVILEKELTNPPMNLNPESVTLKWSSSLKKAETFKDRQSARFELLSQYVLVNTKNKQIILGFDYPSQKKEVGITNPKALSSSLASLIYNLLVSQGAKISSALDQVQLSSAVNISEMKVVGKHGLYDLTLINNFLNEKFKEIQLSSQIKSFDPSGSTLILKSTLTLDALMSQLSSGGGKFDLNEQKILVFSPSEHTFAIIPK